MIALKVAANAGSRIVAFHLRACRRAWERILPAARNPVYPASGKRERGGGARAGRRRGGFTLAGPGHLASRSLSDAVFASAITLLVVSLEVPDTFEELLATMRGFFAFAICFALLVFVWYDHVKFFRRFGLRDFSTVCLNAALLFILLFYVYPLKFLFTLFVEQLLGFGGETIEPAQVPLLMVIYGVGFVAVQFVFVLLYLRAYSLRGVLGLDANEASITRQEIQGFLLNVGVGLASVVIAVLGGQDTVSWAGWVYVLIFPLQTLNGYLMGSRRRKARG